MISAQDLIEKITSTATCDDCIVVVRDKTQANLRWAGSTLTTNGVIQERSCYCYCIRMQLTGGMASGGVTRTDVSLADVPALLEACNCYSQRPLVRPMITPRLLQMFRLVTGQQSMCQLALKYFRHLHQHSAICSTRSVADKIELFGYSEHTNETTWVGSKGGLRLRKDSPSRSRRNDWKVTRSLSFNLGRGRNS